MFAVDFELKRMSRNFGLYDDVSENLVTSLSLNKEDRGVEPFVIKIDVLGSEVDNESFEKVSKAVKIGELEFYAFNLNDAQCDLLAEDFPSFDYDDILDYYMGGFNEDTYNYLNAFKKMYSKVFNNDPDYVYQLEGEPYILCLQRFFIEPEYRGKGVGNYIAKNLMEIVYNVCNIRALYFIGYIKPDDGTDEMKKVQKNLFEKIGCTLLKDHRNNYYFAKSA